MHALIRPLQKTESLVRKLFGLILGRLQSLDQGERGEACNARATPGPVHLDVGVQHAHGQLELVQLTQNRFHFVGNQDRDKLVSDTVNIVPTSRVQQHTPVKDSPDHSKQNLRDDESKSKDKVDEVLSLKENQ